MAFLNFRHPQNRLNEYLLVLLPFQEYMDERTGSVADRRWVDHCHVSADVSSGPQFLQAWAIFHDLGRFWLCHSAIGNNLTGR
jgi:hypothetical protein